MKKPLQLFFHFSRHVVFYSHRGLFAIILPYFVFILPFNFPFSHFLSPFYLFLATFLLFLLHFPPFFSPPFHIFPPNDISWYFPPQRGVFFNISTAAATYSKRKNMCDSQLAEYSVSNNQGVSCQRFWPCSGEAPHIQYQYKPDLSILCIKILASKIRVMMNV
jgi:hypothetical protein